MQNRPGVEIFHYPTFDLFSCQIISLADWTDLAGNPIDFAGNAWVFMSTIIENAKRAHCPQFAAGLTSEYKQKSKFLHLEDSLQLAAGNLQFI